ncbi:MAG: TlpA disulfide reductase family protein [Candidatus Acidiferrales bacterium]
MKSGVSIKLASVALGVVLVCLVFVAAPRAAAQDAAAPQIKVVAPKDVKDLIAANKGKVVFLNFFATYCVPCHTEFPDIEKLQSKYGDKLRVVEVSMNDVTDPAEKTEMAKYLEQQKPPFPVYIASTTDDSYYQGIDPRWAKSEALPMTMIFDKDGKEVHYYEKALTLADMEQDVNPLLAAN